MNIEELKRLAAPLVKWGADSAWENPDGTATVGYIDEDGNRDPILTVDTTIYDGFEGDSLELANFYAAANPAAVLELIAEVDRLRDEVNGMTGTLARIETERNNQTAPQAPAVPELDPMTRLIVSDPKQLKPTALQAPAVLYGVDEEAANRIALAVYDCKNDICPEPLLYAINRILATEAHPLSVEGRDALLPSAEVTK